MNFENYFIVERFFLCFNLLIKVGFDERKIVVEIRQYLVHFHLLRMDIPRKETANRDWDSWVGWVTVKSALLLVAIVRWPFFASHYKIPLHFLQHSTRSLQTKVSTPLAPEKLSHRKLMAMSITDHLVYNILMEP